MSSLVASNLSLCSVGLKELLVGNCLAELKTLYELFNRVDKLEELKVAFNEYIKVIA